MTVANKHNLIDTNVIIKFPSVFQNIDNIHIHLKTVEELDRLKTSENLDLAYRARKAAKLISANLHKITIERKNYGQKAVDDILLHCAKRKKFVLITNDLTLELKSRFNGVESQSYLNGEKTNYTGVKTIEVSSNEEVKSFLTEPVLSELKENQFLIFEDATTTELQTDGTMRHPSLVEYVKKDGNFIKVKDYTMKNKLYPKLKARNVEQKCLINALYDEKINIYVVTGGFGTGKSFITVNFALQQLERGKIDKIVYVPNNAQTGDSREVAAVPGDLFAKESIYMGTLIDNLGIDEIGDRINNGTIELMPISLARGRNIENAIILVNEAQNLTEAHIKLLIGRIGEGTKIIFDGDIQQADRPVFKSSNGIKLLYKLKDSEYADLFCTVKLRNVERSRTAMVADYLDSID